MASDTDGRVNIVLGGSTSITCVVPDADKTLSRLTAAIDAYYNCGWLARGDRKATIQILGAQNVTIPIERILCISVERIDAAKGGGA